VQQNFRDATNIRRADVRNHRCKVTGDQGCRVAKGVGASSCAVEASAGILFSRLTPGLPPYTGPSGKGGLRYKKG
jgi:hypothetical protein